MSVHKLIHGHRRPVQGMAKRYVPSICLPLALRTLDDRHKGLYRMWSDLSPLQIVSAGRVVGLLITGLGRGLC